MTTPQQPSNRAVGEAWAEAEAAVARDGGWFIVTSYDQPEWRGLYTIEGRRWIDPEPITEPVRIFRRPLVEGLLEFAARYEALATHPAEGGTE